MDPLHLSHSLSVDVQNQSKQSLGLNGNGQQSLADNQHVIMPFTSIPPNEENDIIDDHLIDVSSDTRYNYDQNDSRSGWNK